MTNCPPPEALDDLKANRLSAEEAGRLRSHVAGCTACRSRVGGGQGAPGAAQPPEAFPYLSPPAGEGEVGRLGPYRVVGVLGEGGMSVVFDAEEPSLARRVALKVLRPQITDPITRERFLMEARAIASLPNDHVVHLYAVGEANGVPYLAMERLVGESLEDRLKRDDWLPVLDALRVAREAAEGLDVLHRNGVVHRDVKPDNLWLEADAKGRFAGVKLIDFGIAKQGDHDANLTRVGQFLGTPAYVAPEQAVGNPVDGRADLYSLGCVLFRSITGKAPFAGAGSDTVSVLSAVVRGEALTAAELAPNLSPAVASFIQELMQRDPGKRPANASAVVSRLRQLEDEERGAASRTQLLQAGPAAADRRTPRRASPLGLWLGAAAVLLALLVGLGAAYVKFWPNGQQGQLVPSPLTGEPIKVGVLFSRKGIMNDHETPVREAVLMAIEEINQPGQGVLGRPLLAVEGDGASDEARFGREADRLMRDEGAQVMFGCWTSSARRRVVEACRQHDRLLFYASEDEALQVSPHLVALGGTPDQAVGPLVKYLYSHSEPAKKLAGRRKFYLVGSETVFSYAINEVIAHEVEALQATVVGRSYVPLGADRGDAAPVAKAIKDSGADCVIVSIEGVRSNEYLLKEMRSKGLRPPGVLTAWLSLGEAELERLAEDELEGDYSAACYFESLPSKANREFVERFRAKYGKTRHVNDAMQTAYAGVYLWRKAVEQAGTTDTAAVREALRGMSVEAPDGPMKVSADLYAWRTGRVGRIESKNGSVSFRVVYQSPEPLAPHPFPAWRSEKEWKELLEKTFDHLGGRWGKSKQ